MPARFKSRAMGTDAPIMSDTAVNDTLSSFLLDGDAPRLASAPPPPNLPFPDVSLLAAAPATAPLLPAPSLGEVPLLTALAGPSLPAVGPGAALPGAETPADAESAHPMAHLMRKQQSDSAAWATELRAAKKRKARKIKIGLIVGFLAVSALIGPPFGKWLWGAINEAGNTAPEPATTVAPTATSAPSAIEVSVPAPDAGANDAVGGLAGLPGAAEAAVAETNTDSAPAASPATTVAP
jgi:hypothetical protein